MDKGFYSYVKENKDIKTKYSLEWTFDSKVMDAMETKDFDSSMLNRGEYDYLEDAIRGYITVRYNENCLWCVLHEQVLLDGEIVMEQFKDDVVPKLLDSESKRHVQETKYNMEVLQKENDKLKKFMGKYGIDADKLLRKI